MSSIDLTPPSIERTIADWIQNLPSDLRLPDEGSYSPGGCSARGLRAHIGRHHLSPIFIEALPRWDFELARIRGFSLSALVPRAMELLCLDDHTLRALVVHEADMHGIENLSARLTPDRYRRQIAKFLRLLDLFQPGEVNWSLVEARIPDARNIPLDLLRDCDEPFPVSRYL